MGAPIKWSLEQIRDGFERFKTENGRYPTAHEIDACPYLPSARLMQRRFDGIRNTRGLLGHETIDFNSGPLKTETAKRIGRRGFEHELLLETILVQRFGEHFVHVQRPIGAFRKRTDFHVYAKDAQFDVDVFYPENYKTFAACLNVKLRTLAGLKHALYLVASNPAITSANVAHFIAKRAAPIDSRIRIVHYGEFLQIIDRLRPLKVCD